MRTGAIWYTQSAPTADNGDTPYTLTAAEMLGGSPEVQEWEIALMHRMHEAHHGACTRVIWSEMDINSSKDASWRRLPTASPRRGA